VSQLKNGIGNAKYRHPHMRNHSRLGSRRFFLNRTNRSGILKAGVIGGLAQAGEWRLDCRFRKKNFIEKIRRIALYKDQITLTREDASTYLSSITKILPRYAFINIDPPYYRKGPELYCSFYEHADHKHLAQTIRKLRRPWMLTYDNASEIRALYEGLPRGTSNGNQGTDLLRPDEANWYGITSSQPRVAYP